MKGNEKTDRLAKTKSALAEKYDRLAAEARSKPKRTQFMHKAQKYRRQAQDALHEQRIPSETRRR
jgi:hypothetical protein